MKRIEFVKSLFTIPLFVNIKKENTIEEYLIENNFQYDRPWMFASAEGVTTVKSLYKDKITISIYNNGRISIFLRKVNEMYNTNNILFQGKIENVTELKQLFKFLEVN